MQLQQCHRTQTLSYTLDSNKAFIPIFWVRLYESFSSIGPDLANYYQNVF